jgi:prepilin-type N-terminal cleavage/methylation domain-containing protein
VVEGGRNRRNSRGFTLIELLVVIVILGVMSGVAVYAVSGFTKKSQAAACADDQRSIVDAEERYSVQVGGHGTEDQLVAQHLLTGPSSLHDIVLSASDYEVTPVGSCVSDDDVAAGTGAPTAAIGSVRLLDSAGAGLEGAEIASSGKGGSLGLTDADGAVAGTLAPGTYDLSVDYRGETQDIVGATVADGKPADVHTTPLIVNVEGAAGAAISHLGNDGFWVRDDDTDAKGIARLELLEGSYTVRADFNGATNIVSGVSLPKEPFVTFSVARVTLISAPGVRVGHRGNNGEWIEDGATDKSGAVDVSLLPGDYDFRADMGKGHYARAGAGILGDTAVKIG